MNRLISGTALLCLAVWLGGVPALAQRQMERLGRGITAVRKTSPSSQVYVSWRLLGNDPEGIAFNLYRSANGAAAAKLNAAPLTVTTDYTDTTPNFAGTIQYSVRPVVNGVEVPDTFANPLSAPVTLPVNVTARQYLAVPLQPTPDGAHNVKFCWVGDLDGDGEYDFVVDRWHATLGSQRQFLEAYKRDGTFLWRMNMGPNSTNQYNIEPGSSAISVGHGDNVTVYDMDGDGKAEVMVRTANGVVLGDGTIITAANDTIQFLSVINGLTGAERARATVPNPYSSDGPLQGHMGIAYFDGQKPSVLLAAKNRRADEGFQGLTTTWDYRNGSLTQRWSYDADTLDQHAPEAHQIRLGDPDNDGKDEFLDIGYAIDDNGTQKYNIPEVVHGDRFHMADIDPDRPGLETYAIQQNNGSGLATYLFDPADGKYIKKWYAGGVVDVGRGLAADIDPAQKGLELFSTQSGIFNAKGTQIYNDHPFPPEAIWWDGNLSREFLATVGSTAEAPAIARFDPAYPDGQSRIYTIYNQTAPGVYWAYGGRAQFWGDIMGDWREEVICAANDNSELRIYTTTSAATNRLYTLMHNPQYRIQATTKGYVQASYVDYYLGDGMTAPQPPPMVDSKLVWRGGAGASTWEAGGTASWLNGTTNAVFAQGDSVRFDIGANNTSPVVLNGSLQPGALTVYSPKPHTFDGTGGSLTGPMKLTKAGAGAMTISGSHPFTGATTVWDGALIVNGAFPSSAVTIWGGTWGGAPAAGLTGGRLGGAGTLGQPVTLRYRGAITPGNGMGHAATLTLGNGLTAQDGGYLVMDLSDDPTGTTKANDRIAITGNLSLTGKIGLVIKALNGTIPAGQYTLLTYSGTLAGGPANFEVSVPPGTPYTLAVGSGVVRLTVPVTRAPAPVVWRGSGGAWDLASSQNWLRGGNPDIFAAGDTVTFDATGAGVATATLTGALPVAGLTVNAAVNYTLAGTGYLSGTGGLTKTGTGTLTVNTVNDYTGPTTISGGILSVSSLGDAGTPGSIGAAAATASNLVINGGTLQLSGSQTNTNRSLTLGTAGGVLDVATGNSSMQISGNVTGAGRLTKSGPGTLILAENNSYSGGTLISAGTLYLAGTTPNVSGLGTGAVTLEGGTLTMANVQANETAAWNLIVPGGSTGRLNADGRCSLTGTLTGGGTFNYYTPFIRTDLKGNWSAFTGAINVLSGGDGGEMRVTNTFGYGNAAVNLGEDAFVYYNTSSSSPVLDIGELTGAATSGLGGGPTAGRTVTWRVGGRNTDATFDGGIVNSTGTTALTKIGTGAWTLTGASTHTGATNVTAGTLRVAGSLTGTAVTVQNAAALGGTGSITGNVSLLAGGIIEHQAEGATPLTITGNLTLGSSLRVRPQPGVVPVPGTYTVLSYTGTRTGTPSISWQAPSGSGLTAAFDLTTSGVITMTLTALPGTGLQWLGNVSADWDTVTANWTNGAAAGVFANGASVVFGDGGNAAVPINLTQDAEALETAFGGTKNYTLGGTGRLAGSGILTKTGTGTLTLTGAHLFSGGTRLAGGILTIGNAGSLGTGPITLSGGTWAMGALTPQNSVFVSANSTITGGSGSGAQGLKAVNGSGVLTLTATNVFDLEGSLTDFTGTLLCNGSGSFRFFGATGGASTAFDLGTRPLGCRSGTAYSLGSLAGVAGSALGGANGYNAAVTFTIGANNLSSAFGGNINNGNTGSNAGNITHLVKTGTGTLTLGGTNSYTGTTTVNAGRLVVNGSLANTPVTVAAAAGLGGSGTVGGAVTCQGILAPGAAAGATVGSLTVSGGLVLSASSVLQYELGTVSDRTAVTGDLTLDGVLNFSAGPGFGAGTYPILTYTGTLTDEAGLQLGPVPAGYEAVLSTATAGQVRLIVTRILSAYEQWQMARFGSTDDPRAAPDSDPDGDGNPNRIEFRLGLNPLDGGSSFKAAGTLTGAGFAIAWPTAPGLVFEVRRSGTPAGPWTLLTTVTGAGSYTDPAPPSGRGFYQVVLLTE